MKYGVANSSSAIAPQNIQQKRMTLRRERRRPAHAAAKWNVAAGRMLENAPPIRAYAAACAALAAPYMSAKNPSQPLAATASTRNSLAASVVRARASTATPRNRIAAAVKSVATASALVAGPE